MSEESKFKRTKPVFGIAVSVIALAIAIVMVGASFAWTSPVATASVQGVDFSTQKACALEFGVGGSGNDNLPYMGQKALDKYGYLTDPSDPATTNIDAPYYFVSEIEIDTKGREVSLNLQLDSVKISNGGIWLDIYADSIPSDDSLPSYPNGAVDKNLTNFHLNSDVDLAFTWFFKQKSGDVAGSNRATNLGNTEEMRSLMPEGGEIWFTPFGTMKFDADAKLEALNGKTEGTLPDEVQDIKGFAASDDKFDLYIVFAPQRIFWSIFFEQDRISAASCTAEEQKEMLGNFYDEKEPTYRMYYSEERYASSKFYFNAIMTAADDTTSRGAE